MSISKKKYLVVLAGPTAVGKTSMAIKLAQQLNSEIFSADSRQFFREMEIGTAKPNQEELNSVRHHFINSRSIHQAYSVGDFEKDCIPKLDDYYQHNECAILCGGSGLYIKAVCQGLDEFPHISQEVKKQLDKKLGEEGIQALQTEVHEKDPTFYANTDIHNPARLVRALEIIRTTGNTFSSYLKNKIKPRSFTPIYIALEMNREKLYDRINLRVDLMVEKGLVEEAKTLCSHRELYTLQTVGYQELFDHFDGKISLDEAIELIKRNSRRYAKRQMTWLRNSGNYQFFKHDHFREILDYVLERTSES